MCEACIAVLIGMLQLIFDLGNSLVRVRYERLTRFELVGRFVCTVTVLDGSADPRGSESHALTTRRAICYNTSYNLHLNSGSIGVINDN